MREYINEVDYGFEFVNKCIRAVGRIAIRYEKSVDKCLGILSKATKEARNAISDDIINGLLVVLVG